MKGRCLYGWHVARKVARLGFGDERPIEAGVPLTVRGPVEMCTRGLHASTTLHTALKYGVILGRWPGWLCRVRVSGEVLQEGEKLCATRRTAVWMLAPAEAERVVLKYILEQLQRVWNDLSPQLPPLSAEEQHLARTVEAALDEWSKLMHDSYGHPTTDEMSLPVVDVDDPTGAPTERRLFAVWSTLSCLQQQNVWGALFWLSTFRAKSDLERELVNRVKRVARRHAVRAVRAARKER